MSTTSPAFTDETLSAFLDGELPSAMMATVRTALAQDPALAARLGMLAHVDVLVKKQAQVADSSPMPASVLALFATDQATAPAASATIIQGPWQRWRQAQPLAIAASLALIAGLAVGYLNRGPAVETGALPALAFYASSLDTVASGTPVNLGEATLLNRFSFRNQQAEYCRQYELTNANRRSENIACRQNNNWSVVASKDLPAQTASDYQPASAATGLDSVLDSLMAGPALDLGSEAVLIGRHWQDGAPVGN